jgi:outer membrane lipoprotein-sorting protein
MLRKLLITLAAVGIAASSGAAETADELIAKYVAARGGREKIMAINTMKITGSVKIMNSDSPFTLQIKRPGMSRTDRTLQGIPMTQAFDGQTAWMVFAMLGSADPEVLPEAQTHEMRISSSIEGPLVDYKAKGSRVELIGKDTVADKPAYKIKVTTKDNDVMTVYLDAKSFLEVKLDTTRKNEGGEVAVETYFANYQPTGGVLFPRAIENWIKGKASSTMAIDKIELNVPIDDSIFKMPPKAPPPPAEEKKPGD